MIDRSSSDLLISELRATLGKMEMALSVVSDAIVWIDAAGRIQWCNNSFNLMLNRPHIDLLGSRLLDVLPLEQNGRRLAPPDHPATLFLQAETRGSADYEFHAADRTYILEIEGAPVDFGQSGRSIVMVIHDITERIQLHRRLERVNADLERRVADRTAQLSRSNAELEQFAYVAAHHLKEPVRRILIFADRLRKKSGDLLPPAGMDSVARMEKGARQIHDLIQDLLTYSLVTPGERPFVRVDLSDVLREVQSELEIQIEETGGRIEPGDMPIVDADALQMRHLFLNLISNALKFHRPGVAPVIRIRSRRQGDRVEISVEDNGIGFDESYRDRLFVMFERLQTSSEYEGTGIGLAICKKIVERHGGSITAHGRPGQGSTFSVTLPVSHSRRA